MSIEYGQVCDGVRSRAINAAWLLLAVLIPLPAMADGEVRRARDLGVPFEGTPGTFNAITDVVGVEVGQVSIIRGDGLLRVGEGPVRTGVTAIFPRGRAAAGVTPVYAGTFVLNGYGEMTGMAMIDETGMTFSPIMITNTASVGTVRDAVIQWNVERYLRGEIQEDHLYLMPVVAETYDGFLNDILGLHVRKEHVFEAMNSARAGPVAEGNVGGGTGMALNRFKGGIGTSSRRLTIEEGGYTVGVLVQANYGSREVLTVAGVPVGREITDLVPLRPQTKDGSIIIVIATDAPLGPHQLEQMARRATLGLARLGAISARSSGDLFVAFSTVDLKLDAPLVTLTSVNPRNMNPLFTAVVNATEEAIVNALVAARTMTGANGNTVYGIPHHRLQQVLKKYNRLAAGAIEVPADSD